MDSTLLGAEAALVRLGAEGYRPVRLTPAQLDRLVGRYARGCPAPHRARAARRSSWSAADDGLVVVLGPQREPLTATGPLVFLSPLVKLVFQVDERGAVTGVRALAGQRWLEFARVDAGQ